MAIRVGVLFLQSVGCRKGSVIRMVQYRSELAAAYWIPVVGKEDLRISFLIPQPLAQLVLSDG